MADIVYADDERNLRAVIGAHLKLQGHDVRMAGDGREALDMVRDVRPDLVILDVMMPGMNGCTACSVLRADPGTARLPVIALTAFDELVDDTARFDAVVAKPFRMEQLRDCIDALLGEPSAINEPAVS